MKPCTWIKQEGARLGGKDGYIIKYSDGAQWWMPDGTGQCRYYNTLFKRTAEQWRPVNAYCTDKGLLEIRELYGPLIHVTPLDG